MRATNIHETFLGIFFGIILIQMTSSSETSKLSSLLYRPWARTQKITYGYHLGGQRIVVFFDLLDISSQQFSMITTADW